MYGIGGELNEQLAKLEDGEKPGGERVDGFWVCVGDDADWVKPYTVNYYLSVAYYNFFFLSSFIFLYVKPPFSFLVNKN